jgi:hypothetical protein
MGFSNDDWIELTQYEVLLQAFVLVMLSLWVLIIPDGHLVLSI